MILLIYYVVRFGRPYRSVHHSDLALVTRCVLYDYD